LLSGGEKSLVALAFMFAVFLARPCPFYILDEVEAALDDINIDRFLELVRRYSDRAQFIVVTHQKRTMDAADTLYGVSMGADGGKGHHSKCVIHPAYVVKGKLVSFTPDDPATTDTNEASVTLTVTGANKHARRSGVKKGDEVTFTAATDENGFKVKLSGY